MVAHPNIPISIKTKRFMFLMFGCNFILPDCLRMITEKSNPMIYAIEAEACVGAVGDEVNARRRVAPWEI